MNFLRVVWIACLCLALGVAQEPTVPTPLTNERIVELARSGVRQDQLRRTIVSAPQVDFHLTPEAENIMLAAGVTEDTIKAMAAREEGLTGQATLGPSIASSIASVPTETDKQNHTARKWVIIGIAGVLAGGLAYTGYRLANPHHCSADYILGTPVSNPAARTPTCN